MQSKEANEDLNIEQPAALVAYLRRTGRIGADETPCVRTLGGGVSNRTVLVERPTGESWVLKQALAKLRVAVDWFSDPLRIHREALGLRWLEQLAPAGSTTGFIFEDHDHHILCMQAAAEPHVNWKEMLLAGRLEPDHVRQFATWLGTVHRRSSEMPEVAAAFDDRSFFESLRLEPYYGYTASHVPEAAAFLHELIARTRERRFTLTHGDYSPKNVLVHQGRLILIDHEVIHFGDGGFDLGFSLTHLLSKAHHLAPMRTAFADAARTYWRVYRETVGDTAWADVIEGWAVRHTLGCLLARVAGRSPLEYLSSDERQRQRRVVTRMMDPPPATVEAMVERFMEDLDG